MDGHKLTGIELTRILPPLRTAGPNEDGEWRVAVSDPLREKKFREIG
jgi:hypothetical protein